MTIPAPPGGEYYYIIEVRFIRVSKEHGSRPTVERVYESPFTWNETIADLAYHEACTVARDEINHGNQEEVTP